MKATTYDFLNTTAKQTQDSTPTQKTDRWAVIQKKTIVEHGVEEWIR